MLEFLSSLTGGHWVAIAALAGWVFIRHQSNRIKTLQEDVLQERTKGATNEALHKDAAATKKATESKEKFDEALSRYRTDFPDFDDPS